MLAAWNNGDTASLESVLPLVEVELRRIARIYMSREAVGHTLQTTALLNEAYLKLLAQNNPNWESRAHFYGIVSNIMRQVLINYARDRVAQKRGGKDVQHVPLNEELLLTDERSADLIALDEALKELSHFDPKKSQIVELKCFGGLTHEEIAEVLNLSVPTVKLYWRIARAWLASEIRGDHSLTEPK